MEIRWNQNLAYAVGLLVTDGNLSGDGRHMELTSKDMEQLHTFKRCLKLKNRIGRKRGGYTGAWYPRIQFGDVNLYRWLVTIGLMPCKSKRLGPLAIPDNYFFDFLRGHLDGDGCVRTFQDPVYPNATRLYVTFSSASRSHLEWIHRTVRKSLGVPGSIVRGTRIWELTYAKKASQKLLKALYYRHSLPCLKRKLQIARPFLQE